MLQKNLTGAGVPPLAVQQMVGNLANSLTGAGSTQGTALALTSDFNVVTTTASSTGVILPTCNAGDEIWVVNYGANTLSVYPPTGGKIQNGSANGAFSVATVKTVLFKCIDTINFAAVLTA